MGWGPRSGNDTDQRSVRKQRGIQTYWFNKEAKTESADLAAHTSLRMQLWDREGEERNHLENNVKKETHTHSNKNRVPFLNHCRKEILSIS